MYYGFQTDGERQTQRETDGQSCTHTNRQTYKQTGRYTEIHTDRLTQKDADKSKNIKHTNNQTEIPIKIESQ